MCEEFLKAVSVIKTDMEEYHVLGVDDGREDMCEHDTVWEGVAGDEGQDLFYDGLRDSVTGEDLEASQVRAGCDAELE